MSDVDFAAIMSSIRELNRISDEQEAWLARALFADAPELIRLQRDLERAVRERDGGQAMTRALVCRVPTLEEREALIRDFPDYVTPFPVKRPRIALLGCGAQKASRTCAASEMYRSSLFRAGLRWSLVSCDATYILSAKHGLLGLGQVIEPYDETLPRSQAERDAWGRRVGAQIVAAVGEIDAELVVLAGEKYADAIEFSDPEWEYEWSEPLRGLGVGERLAWFAEQRRGR